MPRCIFLDLSLPITLLVSYVYAQSLGTITQDIATSVAYSQQKKCAQSCFQNPGPFCPLDVLGFKIGCAQSGACVTSGWQARNDCYCRSDLQIPGQEFLSNCISKACSVADVSVDISSAVSIYSRYCGEKGYTAGAPATTFVTTTDTSTPTKATSQSLRSLPTATATSSSPDAGSNSDSSGSSSLSTGTIIGIVVGALASLLFLSLAMRIFWKLFASCFRKKPSANQHQLPALSHQLTSSSYLHQYPFHSMPDTDSQIGPCDSISMVGGLARPTPTLVSDFSNASRWN